VCVCDRIDRIEDKRIMIVIVVVVVYFVISIIYTHISFG
jgi:hypothetical protein